MWPNGEMPVVFDENTIPKGSHERGFIEATMSQMNKELCGCFRFRYKLDSNLLTQRKLKSISFQACEIDRCQQSHDTE